MAEKRERIPLSVFYLKPHHAYPEDRESVPPFGILYYLSQNPRFQDDNTLYTKVSQLHAEDRRGLDRLYRRWGGAADIIGNSEKERSLYVSNLVALVKDIRKFPGNLKIVIGVTLDDPICTSCIGGNHCKDFQRQDRDGENEIAGENVLAMILCDWLNSINPNSATLKGSKICQVTTTWEALRAYYEDQRFKYKGIDHLGVLN